jgi:hypothetical protein
MEGIGWGVLLTNASRCVAKVCNTFCLHCLFVIFPNIV